MGRLQRIENKLERAINGAFAKAFRAEVQPVEIASAVRRAMDDGATALAKGRTYVPTSYRVELSESDYERLHTYEADLEEELLAAAEEQVSAVDELLGQLGPALRAEWKKLIDGGPEASRPSGASEQVRSLWVLSWYAVRERYGRLPK